MKDTLTRRILCHKIRELYHREHHTSISSQVERLCTNVQRNDVSVYCILCSMYIKRTELRRLCAVCPPLQITKLRRSHSIHTATSGSTPASLPHSAASSYCKDHNILPALHVGNTQRTLCVGTHSRWPPAIVYENFHQISTILSPHDFVCLSVVSCCLGRTITYLIQHLHAPFFYHSLISLTSINTDKT